MSKGAEIPFAYGKLVTVTGSGTRVVMWFSDHTEVVRGIIVDFTTPSSPTIHKDEIVIRRRTEGQTRKRKLPPVGNPLG